MDQVKEFYLFSQSIGDYQYIYVHGVSISMYVWDVGDEV